MALQLSVAVRNARLDAFETAVGANAVLKMFTGAPPANCAAADTGTLLVNIACGADYMSPASGGTKAKSTTWQDLIADGTGSAGHFRIYSSDGTTCGLQGTLTATGGGGDMTIDNVSIVAGQSVTVTGFTLTDANA